GRLRPALQEADIAPRPVQERLPICVGGGGSPASAVNTGRLGLPMALALLLGPITRHERTVELCRYGAEAAGHDPDSLPISINSHGYVGRTSQQAREVMYPYFASGMAQNNPQRDVGQIIPRAAFDAQSSPGAGLLVGSPEEVIDKLLAYHELYGQIGRAHV